MKTTEEIAQEQLEISNYPQQLQALLDYTQNLLKNEEITPDELQWQVMLNHFDAMIARAKTGEKLPEMDEELFSELSKRSMDLAKIIVQQVPDIQDSEKFLVAVHIENVLGNI